MFNEVYSEWNRNRAKTIVDYYGYKFFYGKKILDLGAGQGELAAVFLRLGAEVVCADIRIQNLREINTRHPAIKTVRLDLENEWHFDPFQFDVVISAGVLCHLKNYDNHIKRLCTAAEYIVLETEVLDDPSPDAVLTVYEERSIDDLSFHGQGSILSASNVQNRLSSLGATFKRFDNIKSNSGPYKYDWREAGVGRKHGNRRMWFARKDKFIANQLDILPKIHEAERQLSAESSPDNPPPPPIPTQRATPSPALEKVRVPGPPIYSQPSYNVGENRYTTTSKIRLFYYYPEESNPERRKEIDLCFEKNIDNKFYDIVVLQSDIDPTFNFYFEKINKLSGPDDINIICNPDVFFDSSVALVERIKSKEFYALSPWDWQTNGRSIFSNTNNNQDAWVVRGKVEGVDGNIAVNSTNASGRIAYEFNKASFSVSNPSRLIKAFHYNNIETVVRSGDESDLVLNVEPTIL